MKNIGLFIFGFIYTLCIHSQVVYKEHIFRIDSVEVDSGLKSAIESVLYNNEYYSHLNDADKLTYCNGCFYLFFDKETKNNKYRISMRSKNEGFVDKKCAYFKIGAATFLAKGKIPSKMLKRTNKFRQFKKEKIVPHKIPKYAIVEEDPGVIIVIYYDTEARMFTTNDYSVRDIYEVSDEDPSFPGGKDSLKAYLTIQSKKIGVNPKIRGVVKFIIEKDGSTSNVTVLKKENDIPDSWFVETILNMPPWTPARHKGEECRRYFVLPIIVDEQ